MSRDVDAETVSVLAAAAGFDLAREDARVLAPIADEWFRGARLVAALVGQEAHRPLFPVTHFRHPEEASGTL